MVQLGWVSDREVSLKASSHDWSGDIYPMSAYSTTSSSDKMVVYISTKEKKEEYLYVTYNKASGANIDTYEGADQVLVHTKKWGLYSYEYSYLVSKLSVGEAYIHTKPSITISFNSESSNGSARVVIGDDDADPCPTKDEKKEKFYWKTIIKKGKEKHKGKKCKWLKRQKKSERETYCLMTVAEGKYDLAINVCAQTCCLLDK